MWRNSDTGSCRYPRTTVLALILVARVLEHFLPSSMGVGLVMHTLGTICMLTFAQKKAPSRGRTREIDVSC